MRYPLAGGVSPTGNGEFVNAIDLAVGNCYNDDQEGANAAQVGWLELASCTAAHDNEVFALIPVPGAPTSPTPE
jgi:hypothetical protein